MTIWKYQLETKDTQSISMPIGARILSVRVQGEWICVWAIVNPLNEQKPRPFLIAGTGHQLPDDMEPWRFVGTVQQGPFVWHVFQDLR